MKNAGGIKTFLSKFGINYSIVNRLMLAVMLVVEVVIFSNLTQYFFQLDNLLPVGREIATLGIVAIGQTMCILTGGFDLSVGGSAAIAGIVVGYFCSPSKLGLPYGVGFTIAILVAVLVGIINGTLITKVKINPLIATLSMNFMLGGAVILISKQPITVNTAAFKFIGATTFGPMLFPLPIITLAVLYVGFGLILKHTVFGRRIYCTGGNTQAARVAGINVESVIFKVYVLSSLLSGLAGIQLASRIATSNPSIGSTYGLESIAAAVLGGTVLAGGEGNMFGTFLGVLVMGILSNGLVILGLPVAWRNIATGVVLVIAVALQNATKNTQK
ncbi:MAG: ABC transporter permease [Treponema sp.]|nr:ABC transporter permease [Treponema sp.]